MRKSRESVVSDCGQRICIQKSVEEERKENERVGVDKLFMDVSAHQWVAFVYLQ